MIARVIPTFIKCEGGSQQTFACSKSTLETVEENVKYIQRQH